MPSRMKSIGRSFICASSKNPSLESGTRSMPASSAAPLQGDRHAQRDQVGRQLQPAIQGKILQR
jgi:hypothetical protein